MKVEDLMTRQVVTVTPETSIWAAARLMLDHKISGLPVVTNEGRVVGIISEHDLLRGRKSDVQTARAHWLRLMIEQANLTDESARFQERKVGEAMTSDPVTITETAPLEELDAKPKPLQFEGGTQSGQPAAYNCYTACNHDRSMTDNFSLLLREARCLSGR